MEDREESDGVDGRTGGGAAASLTSRARWSMESDTFAGRMLETYSVSGAVSSERVGGGAFRVLGGSANVSAENAIFAVPGASGRGGTPPFRKSATSWSVCSVPRCSGFTCGAWGNFS